jgi:hypothetical protein
VHFHAVGVAGCPEEIALEQSWINAAELTALSQWYDKTD